MNATPPSADGPDRLDRTLGVVSAAPLALIVALTFMDVFARYVFASPVRGASEIIQFAMALAVFAALPLVTRHGEHVTVDLLTHKLSGRMRSGLQVMCEAASGVALAIVAWRLWVQAGEFAESATATIVLGWGMAPLAYAMCGFAVVTVGIVVVRLRDAWRRTTGPVGDAA